MKNKILYNTFIIGFIILYIATALISLSHAIEFFDIGNVKWMSITLASVFELGQMVVLSSLLLSDNKKTLIPWLLLIILTCVQIVGNVYSVYKYISLSQETYYIYLQQSLIDWWLSGVSQSTIIVIISWIIGALLPVIALFMTSMVANNIQLRNSIEVKEPKLSYEPKIIETQDIPKEILKNKEPEIKEVESKEEIKIKESEIKEVPKEILKNKEPEIKEVKPKEEIKIKEPEKKEVKQDNIIYTGDIINAIQKSKG